jgi:phage gpG-like protein
MAVRMSFEFYGDVQLDRTLARFVNALEDARPAWEALADRFARTEARQFRTEGGFSGGWAPLSQEYAAWKGRHYPGKPILEREGDLKRSLTRRPFGVEVIEPGFMLVGSDVEYGRWHQQGTDRMPRRRPVEFTEGERRTWVRLLQRFIVTGVAADRL